MKRLPDRRAATMALYEELERGDLSLEDASRRMRRIAGLSQAAYAELVGISAQALMDFERGRSNPTLKTLRAIGRPFGLDVGFRRRKGRT